MSNATAGCVAAVMDINGSKKPNKLSEDVVLLNAMGFGSGCGMEIAGKCFSTAIVSYAPLSQAECMAKKGALGIKDCAHPNLSDSDYWGGAVKACGGVDRMPTQSDLAAIATLLYGVNINVDQAIHNGLTYNNKIGSQLGLPAPMFGIWSGEVSNNTASSWYYYSDATSGSSGAGEGRNNTRLAVCLVD